MSKTQKFALQICERYFLGNPNHQAYLLDTSKFTGNVLGLGIQGDQVIKVTNNSGPN
jgi:hypothetical protein